MASLLHFSDHHITPFGQLDSPSELSTTILSDIYTGHDYDKPFWILPKLIVKKSQEKKNRIIYPIERSFHCGLTLIHLDPLCYRALPFSLLNTIFHFLYSNHWFIITHMDTVVCIDPTHSGQLQEILTGAPDAY